MLRSDESVELKGSRLIRLTWPEIDQALDLLETSVRETGVEIIAGIARAGLIPAVILAHRLGIRDFVAIEIRRTTTDGVNAAKIKPFVSASMNEGMLVGKSVLLVDDIVGAGITMDLARSWISARCSSLTTCSLVVNLANLDGRSVEQVADHVGCVVNGWVRFPWETR